MNPAQAFKSAMDKTDLRPAVLAEAVGRSRNNISSIRNGKTSPKIDDFWMLLNAAEQLQPGFIEEWVKALLGAKLIVREKLSPALQARLLSEIADSLLEEETAESKVLIPA